MNPKRRIALVTFLLGSAIFIATGALRLLLWLGGQGFVASYLTCVWAFTLFAFAVAALPCVLIIAVLDLLIRKICTCRWTSPAMAGKAILVGCIGTILLILVVFCPIHITPIGRFTLLGYICPGGRCVLTGSLPQESLDGTFRGVLETTFVDKNSHSKITETTYQVQVGSYQSKQHVLRQSQIRLTIPVALPSFPRSFSRDEVEITAILRGNGVVFSDGSTQKSAFGGPGGGTVYYSTTDVPIQETVGRAELRLRSGNWFDTLTRWSLSTIGQLSIGVLYLLLLDWICFVVFELVKEKKS